MIEENLIANLHLAHEISRLIVAHAVPAGGFLRRFRQIVKGKIKQDLKKYVTHGEMIARKGKDTVSIPMPQIQIPKFRFGDRNQGGVGQGPGNPGDPVMGGDPQEGPGEGQGAGKDPGEHQLEVDLTLQELAEILGDELELRWFTPAVEVDLCGHATLATAHALWTNGYASPEKPLRFQTRSGVLTCRLVDGWIELDFPALPAVAVEPPPGLVESLDVAPVFVGRTRFDHLIALARTD